MAISCFVVSLVVFMVIYDFCNNYQYCVTLTDGLVKQFWLESLMLTVIARYPMIFVIWGRVLAKYSGFAPVKKYQFTAIKWQKI